MTNPKKYRLLKDISTFDVEAKAGCIGIEEKETSTDSKVWFDNGRFFYRLSTINTFPDWFELVEPERIEVTVDKGTFGTALFVKCATAFPEEKFPAIKAAIEGVINSGTHICKHCNAEVSEPDEKCYKAPAQPLFVTEDGVEKFAGNDCFYVDLATWYVSCWYGIPEDISIISWKFDSCKYFSTEEAALGYRLFNKPCLSLMEVGSIISGNTPLRVIEEIKKLAQSKQ